MGRTSTGVTLERNNGASWDTIGEVMSIQPGGITKEALEVTPLAVANGVRGYIQGLKNNEEVTIGLYFDPAIVADAQNQALLRGDVSGDTPQDYRVNFPDSGPQITWENAVATGFEVGDLNHEVLEATFRFQPVEFPTWTDSPA